MTVPTRQPNTARPYPMADPSAGGPRSEYSPNGWVPVIIAGVVAAFVIAIAGVIAGVVVVNIRESAPRAPKPVAASVAPAATLPAAPVSVAETIVPRTTQPAPVDNLDPAAVQRGVVRVLGDSYGLDDVREVKCPGAQPAEAGTVFECTLRVDGVRKSVTVSVTDRDGTYEVSRPH